MFGYFFPAQAYPADSGRVTSTTLTIPTGALVFGGLAPVQADSYAFLLELAGFGNGWTDVTMDVADLPIVVQRGFQSDAIDDLVAAPSTLALSLNNGPSNNERLQSYYSPDNLAARLGFDTGIRCRYDVTANNRTRTRFIGWIQTIDPKAGLYEDQTTAITAASWMAIAQGTLAGGVGVQTGLTGDQLIALLAALPTFPPPATRYAVGIDAYPYAFDDLTTAAYVVDGLDSIAKSGQDRIYELADGTLVYETRLTRQLGAGSALTFSDVAPPGQPGLALTTFPAQRNLADVYSAIQVTVHPKNIDAAAVVLYQYLTSASAASIVAGTSLTLLGSYQDPTQLAQSVGGVNMITAAGIGTSGSLPATDWQITTAPNGGGADISASCTVTVVYSATGATFTITNNSGVLGYIAKLQCRGQGVYNYQQVTASAMNSSTAAALGKKSVTIDCPYQAIPSAAQSLVNYLIFVAGIRRSSLGRGVSIFMTADDKLTQDQVLALEVGQAVIASETVTGLLGIFWINNIKETYDERMNVTVELQLTPMVVNPVPTGALTFTGFAPSVVIHGISITVPTGSFVLGGQTPAVGNAPVWLLGTSGSGELGTKTDLS